MKIRAKRSFLVRPTSSIVIEGFPRSANTYSVAAFEHANGRDLHVGHHFHAAAHVMRAVRLSIPTLVLVRHPNDAIASYLMYRPTIRARDAATEYVDFYSKVLGQAHGFVVGRFEDVVSDYGSVLELVNARFGTRFSTTYEPGAEEAIFAKVEEMERESRESRGEVAENRVARPSAVRAKQKDKVLEALAEPSIRKLLQRAEALYEECLTLG